MLYGLFAGIIVPNAGFLPSTVFNYSFFSDTIGIPIQAFRALCAVIITYSMIKVLEIFDLEAKDELIRSRDHLDMMVQDRTRSLIKMNTYLEQEIAEHKSAKDLLR